MEYCQASTRRNSGTHVMYLPKRRDLESCSCIQDGLLCADACTKVDCENYWDIDITDMQYDKYSSDEDEYEEIWNAEWLK